MTSNKIIIFDLGGVILDFSHNIICNRLSKISGFSASEIYSLAFSSGLEKLYDEGKISSQEFFRKATNLLKIEIPFDQFKEIWSDIFTENFKMSELIRSLKKLRHTLFLLSNTNEMHFEFCLSKFGILKEFDEFLLSYKVGISKPSKEIFDIALNKSGLLKEDHLFIDDREENVAGAITAGMLAVQYFNIEQLENEINKFLKIKL